MQSPTKIAKIDLSSRAAIERYLTSIGVDPKGIVVQRGKRNYAGPNCPGKAWSCTKALRVLQIGLQNTFECQPEEDATVSTNTDALQECVIVQPGPAAQNQASCVQKSKTVPFVKQRCSITQTGEKNHAHVMQVIDQDDSAEEGAVQTADVEQNATASENHLQIHQQVRQTTKGDVDQDAYQVANVVQDAASAGFNKAQVHQTQDQKANGGSDHKQNDGSTAFTPPPDCHPFVFPPDDPNICANVGQESDTGNNDLHLKQTLDEDARTKELADQQQGFSQGGLDGRVHQVTSAPGRQLNNADQSKSQKLSAAPGSDQKQFDPGGCCGVSQIGGEGNKEDIDQASDQAASEGEALQEINLIGFSSSPNGDCTITHKAKNNADQTSVSESLDPCPALVVTTSCTSGVEGGECAETEVVACPPGTVFNPDTGACEEIIVEGIIVDVAGAFSSLRLLQLRR